MSVEFKTVILCLIIFVIGFILGLIERKYHAEGTLNIVDDQLYLAVSKKDMTKINNSRSVVFNVRHTKAESQNYSSL